MGKKSTLTHLFLRLRPHWQTIILSFLIISYLVYFTSASFLRYTNFYTGRFDLGNMDQTVWNTTRGRIFQFTNPDGTNIVSRLAFHADFILVLLAPFYFLWRDPRMLLLIQTVVLSLGAVFVYKIANDILKNKTISLALAAAYLLNPSMEFSNLYDFHAVTLATTFFLAAFYYFKHERFFLTALFLTLAALTKEQLWVVGSLFGLYIGFFSKKRILGFSLFGSFLLIFYYVFFIAIPKAHGGAHFALSYYSDFGTTPTSILKTIVLSPQKTLATIFAGDRILYLLALFLPLGFFSLLSPFFLIGTLPDFAINLLSNNSQLHEIFYQYTAVITPFLFIAAIFGIKKFVKRFKNITFSAVSIYILICTLAASYGYGPIIGTRLANADMFLKPLPYAGAIDEYLQNIPPRYSIAATNNLGSHLSHRQKIFTIPVGINDADIVLFLLNDPFAQPSLNDQKKMADQLKRNKDYIEIFKLNDFVVFEKRNLYLRNQPNTNRINLFPVSIPTLQKRDYVGGDIHITKQAEKTNAYTSYIIQYPSDGLLLSGLMSVPNHKPPTDGFPVVIVSHGYVPESIYKTESTYKGVVDYFASNGFMVIKPDFRNNGNSEKDPVLSGNLAYPIDILNLISSLPSIEDADSDNIFMWGHSVGATIALTATEVADSDTNEANNIRALALWAPAIDPFTTYTTLQSTYPDQQIPYQETYNKLGNASKNRILWESVSPLYYLRNIKTPIAITHGAQDTVISYTTSLELYNDLISLAKPVSLQILPNADHVLNGYQQSILQKNVMFFKSLMQNSFANNP